MKGLLIVLFYAIKGLYQVFAALLIIPFTFDFQLSLPVSCGFFYYLVNIVIGVAALLLFVCVARGYKNRVRDEPCNIHLKNITPTLSKSNIMTMINIRLLD